MNMGSGVEQRRDDAATEAAAPAGDERLFAA